MRTEPTDLDLATRSVIALDRRLPALGHSIEVGTGAVIGTLRLTHAEHIPGADVELAKCHAPSINLRHSRLAAGPRGITPGSKGCSSLQQG